MAALPLDETLEVRLDETADERRKYEELAELYAIMQGERENRSRVRRALCSDRTM